MPSVIRFKKSRYLAPSVDLTELFDQIPQPMAYFDADNRLSACNLSFRNNFPVVIESQFLRRAGAGPATGQFNDNGGDASRLMPAPLAKPRAALNPGPPVASSARRGDLEPHLCKLPDGGTLMTFRDQTALRKMEESHRREIEALKAELAVAHQARQQATDSARARTDFLMATSHELRTPLNAVLGFSEILATEMFGPLQNARYREYARIIHDSGNHVLSLVNDLLDLAKLDAGKLELRIEPVQVLKIVIDCVRSIETQATRDHIGVSIHVHDGIDRIFGDDKRLRQMVLNLLSNALKFTPVGGEIVIDAFRRGGGIAIAVSDTGIGIKAEDIPKVLEPFGQVDGALSRKHAGTGLGLPLTRELAELHGGSLTVESRVNRGTTVTITLPTDARCAAAPAAIAH